MVCCGAPPCPFGDEIRASQPVRFSEISLRPQCRMIGMAMVEAGDFEIADASLAQNLHEFQRVNGISVLRRVFADVGCANCVCDGPSSNVGAADKHAATLVRICFLAVRAKIVIYRLFDAQYAHIADPCEMVEQGKCMNVE